MPARLPTPAPLALAGTRLATRPALPGPNTTSAVAERDRYRFAKWRAPGR